MFFVYSLDHFATISKATSLNLENGCLSLKVSSSFTTLLNKSRALLVLVVKCLFSSLFINILTHMYPIHHHIFFAKTLENAFQIESAPSQINTSGSTASHKIQTLCYSILQGTNLVTLSHNVQTLCYFIPQDTNLMLLYPTRYKPYVTPSHKIQTLCFSIPKNTNTVRIMRSKISFVKAASVLSRYLSSQIFRVESS